MTALTLPRSVPEWRRLARQALTWWLAELSGMLPARLNVFTAPRGADELVLEYGRKQIWLRGRALGTLGGVAIPCNADSESSASWVHRRFSGFAARAILTEDFVLRAEVELPATAEPEMTKILQHQLERLVPMDPNTVSFVWRVADRIPTRKAIKIAVGIVKNTTISSVQELCGQLGLRATTVLVMQNDGEAKPIWVARVHDMMSRRQRQLCRILEVATILCGIAAYGIHIVRLDHQIDDLREQLTALRVQSTAVQQAAQSTKGAEGELAAIERKLSAPTSLAILDALTVAIPLDASLSEVHFQGNKIEIIGTAVHATALLPLINGSQLFSAPAFSAPVTAAPGGGEHFELKFQVRSRDVP